MANVTIALPPMDEISLVSIWIETLLYGLNCMVYGLCMYLLTSRSGRISSRWVLVLTSTVLFVLSTIYVAASLRQLLEAFIYVPPGVPNYATLYFVEYTLPMRTLKDVLYVSLLTRVGEIWRLYIVFNRDWRIPILFLTNSPPGTAYADTILFAIPNTNLPGLVPLTVTSWALDLIVNVSVTLTIAARLWWMGRNVTSFRADHSSSNPYSYSIYVIVESGAIFASATIVMLALYISENGSPFPYAIPSLDVASQLAVLTPLLIVVRVGLHQSSVTSEVPESRHSATSVPSQVKLLQPMDVEADVELHEVSSRLQGFPSDTKV
ncbi:hypothetical protein J3R83DRAFT_13974 [Lanmaoa asiatica]|nr:hypothetical protein J3R83DRAFT_13974 [Lanmaoa asiatica]